MRRIVTLVSLLAAALVWLPQAAAVAAGGTPFVACPEWTADGTGLVYCAGEGEAAEIWELDVDGTVPRQLTYLGGKAASPDVSPDGSLVVFQAYVPGEPGPQIYVIPRVGSRARALMVGGTLIEFDGVRATQLTTEGTNWEPSWSTDGSRIAFVSDRTGAPQVWVMNADGSGQAPLALASRR
jgi:Tol biopolymer transport system component